MLKCKINGRETLNLMSKDELIDILCVIECQESQIEKFKREAKKTQKELATFQANSKEEKIHLAKEFQRYVSDTIRQIMAGPLEKVTALAFCNCVCDGMFLRTLTRLENE